jgi:drug/metabolite transporter (DMT)-like permease
MAGGFHGGKKAPAQDVLAVPGAKTASPTERIADMKRNALIMAVVTTFLWAGSYILNKLAFQGGIGPLTLSGLRYLLASLLLFCLGVGRKKKEGPAVSFWLIVLLGLLGYAVAQGLQYVGQSYLPPTQSSMFRSVGTTIVVMLVDRVWLRENQTGGDLVKMLLLVAGIILYSAPWDSGAVSIPGLVFMLLSSVGYALNMTLNRRLLTTMRIDARTLVARPMFVGAVVLLSAGLLVEGMPVVTGKLLIILAYLGGISGALGFYLWTRSQAALTAFESSGINNLLLVEIALLDHVVFGRSFSARQIVAIFVVFGAVVSIQGGRKPRG